MNEIKSKSESFFDYFDFGFDKQNQKEDPEKESEVSFMDLILEHGF